MSILGGVFFCRMAGLFLPLSVMAVAARQLEGFSPFLLGLALGVHGLAQALLQLPFALLSDRFGRRRLIVAGLLVFALGSFLAVVSETMYGLACARALQGAGAISSVMMACATDYLRPVAHAKGMAFIGLGIGSAFILSLPVAPLLTMRWGLDGIFMGSAALGLAAAAFVLLGLPADSDAINRQRLPSLSLRGLKRVLVHPGLAHLNAGIFALHFILAANFLVLPIIITDLTALQLGQHWQFYAPLLLLSFALLLPYLAYAERHQKTRPFFIMAVVLLLLSQLALAVCFLGLPQSHVVIGSALVSLLVFFFAFNYLEANMPALVGRYSPVGRKGAAMGFLSSAQFLGVFSGAVSMAGVAEWGGASALYCLTALLAMVWLLLTLSMPTPPLLADFMFKVELSAARNAQWLSRRLARLPGVTEVLVDDKHGAAYLKINRLSFDSEQLLEFQKK